ncbi:MAG TPA: adenylate/guanylate cyclase domain-containing protein [Gaiellaceae bacterium]|nr:adenylate/guanylate cyclase domain-containing protein [Gaiellaceae bacterium]
MLVCTSCGADNREGARFCDSCGAPLAAAVPAREVRKVVTVLFCDVTGSTALGERIDPESLRHVMSRYFETAKAIVERHGGTVEKFIGDAVMAVFGVPAVHEDDALRAVRAADELRAGLGELNDELERGYGTRLELRMGVNTGEVVTGTDERLATGDAVNVAARLEQGAQPGEVLLGDETYRLVRAAVEAEPAAPLEAKGKSEPLTAYRLLSVQPGMPDRRHDAPMIGRQRQQRLLEDAFDHVVSERSCHLFTILGAAGVGKSRLAQEFLARLDGATVVGGRCLSYGEGISYWPVTEVVKRLAPDGAGGPLASILGDDSAAASPEEIAWAFRKLLESVAAERPLVVLFDDLHWGEPTFLDLIEHVADLSRDAPILLLCMARPELLDARPTWGGGKLNASNVSLEPLARAETAELLAALGDGIDDDLSARILEASGGNPLFVEEMVAMTGEGERDIAVPPTIQALLAARLDQLEPGERGVLERGAVEGQVFHRGAVLALAPDEPQVDGRLVTLVRKDLVRPEPALLPDDDAYRFRHLLIRDTAYEALPKATRALLHERFAVWLEEHGPALVELDEIVGYHLEQAYRYRAELGPLDAAAAALAERGAARLLKSAERARERGDVSAAAALQGRAVGLLPPEAAAAPEARLDLAIMIADLGDYQQAAEVRQEAEAAARAAGDERLLARAVLAAVEERVGSDPTGTLAEALELVGRSLAELERLGDVEGAIWALRLLGTFTAWSGDGVRASEYWSEALARSTTASPRLADDIRVWLMWAAWWGPMPADDVLVLCDEIEAETASVRIGALVTMIRAATIAMTGQVEEGRNALAAGRAQLLDLGDRLFWSGTSMMVAELELYAGDFEQGLHELAGGRDVLEQQAGTGYLSTVVGYQAHLSIKVGRDEEALALAAEAEQMGQADDFEPHARARIVRGVVSARRGDFEGANAQLAEAADLIEPRDFVILHLDLAFARAEVAQLAGRDVEARTALEHAISIAAPKGHVLAVEQARAALAQLGG